VRAQSLALICVIISLISLKDNVWSVLDRGSLCNPHNEISARNGVAKSGIVPFTKGVDVINNSINIKSFANSGIYFFDFLGSQCS
jgi:hypothetical protein